MSEIARREKIKGTPLRRQMGRDILKYKLSRDGMKNDLQEKYQEA